MTTPEPPSRRRKRHSTDSVRGRVRAHDPFELIRWLALSQPDPRKALAELVQNSLDAGAKRIRIVRQREQTLPSLRIVDDGEGVIPEMERKDALQYIATHIGHSRKRALSPQERYSLMTQGQYGIGLLGFWSLGAMLEMRTAVPGQRPHRLVLYRDRPEYVVEPLRGKLGLDERSTEILVVGLHRSVLGALQPRRAADYLAAELRGQLVAREIELVIEDKSARGPGQKLFAVKPPRFLGERLQGLGPVDVPGYAPARLEIYLALENGRSQETHGIGVYAAGTLVAQGFQELAPVDLDHEPWTDSRLTGLVDFPGFQVAPGSRRGILVDDAAEAFARAMRTLEPLLLGILERLERQRAEALDRTLIRDLQRAFRDFYRHRPRYDLLPLQDAKDPGRGDEGAGTNLGGDGAVDRGSDTDDAVEPLHAAATLLPPGPLAMVRLVPASLRLVARSVRAVRAIALDATERSILVPVEFSWSLDAAVGSLLEDEQARPGRVRVHAGEEPGLGMLRVTAHAGGLEVQAQAVIEVVDELSARRASEGIPEPELVNQTGAAWRSRLLDKRWQVNTAHPEYRAIAEQPTLKLRYLAMLFAKEVVLRSHQDPRLEQPLEQLVEVAAYADRNLAAGRTPRRTRQTSRATEPE